MWPKPPRTLTRDTWPPDYTEIFAWRQKMLRRYKDDPAFFQGALAYYKHHPVEFINHWMDTYDPRNAGVEGKLTRMPFILFERQAELVEFLYRLIDEEEDGLIEKCRDAGATWVSCAVSWHLWRFFDGVAIGWGSRKEILVDKIGDPDSIFQKLRIITQYVPRIFWPQGFDPSNDMSFMKIINPETDATIAGEAGDNIGRGGRKRIYFKDESAHYERPELIEAALGDNTRVQVDISSVNGLGNVFHRRRENGVEWQGGPLAKGKTNVFVFDWRDHPEKTDEWYARRKKKAKDDGLLHKFAQEVDRDYASAVEGIVIPAEWVNSAIDAHKKLKLPEATGRVVGGLDVADEGGDKNALGVRKSYMLMNCEDWAQGTTGETTVRAIRLMKPYSGSLLNYDCIGVGAGVKSDAKRINPKGLRFHPWNAAAAPVNKEKRLDPSDYNTPKVKDFFHNLKAQAWWSLRARFERTHRAVTEGIEYDPEDLISLPSDLRYLDTLRKELSQAQHKSTPSGKMVIDKKPPGTTSPNLADAVVMAYSPTEQGPMGILG